MHRRWMIVVAGVAAMILIAGCGRVDLEDLTPEAVRTQQAQEAASQPTPATGSGPAGGTGTEETAEGSGVAIEGDIAGGSALYNAQCSGCHEGGRAASLKGQVFNPEETIPKLRTGEGLPPGHPVYRITDITPLTDSDLQDILAYLAAQ